MSHGHPYPWQNVLPNQSVTSGSNHRSSTPSNSSIFSGRTLSTAPSTASSAAWARPPPTFAQTAQQANPYAPMLPTLTLGTLAPTIVAQPFLRARVGGHDNVPRLVWDVRTRPSQALVGHGGPAITSSYLQLPITSPPTSTLYIIVRGLPWTITLRSANPAQPLTVQLLLESIYKFFQTPVTATELSTLWTPQMRAAILLSASARSAQDVCRMDVLQVGRATMYGGIANDEAYAREVFGISSQNAEASSARSVVMTLTLTT